jgi:hypothetical protein
MGGLGFSRRADRVVAVGCRVSVVLCVQHAPVRRCHLLTYLLTYPLNYLEGQLVHLEHLVERPFGTNSAKRPRLCVWASRARPRPWASRARPRRAYHARPRPRASHAPPHGEFNFGTTQSTRACAAAPRCATSRVNHLTVLTLSASCCGPRARCDCCGRRARRCTERARVRRESSASRSPLSSLGSRSSRLHMWDCPL